MYIYTCTYMYIFIYLFIHFYIYTFIHMCMHIHIPKHIYTYIYQYVYICMYIYIHIYIIYIFIYNYKYLYIYVWIYFKIHQANDGSTRHWTATRAIDCLRQPAPYLVLWWHHTFSPSVASVFLSKPARVMQPERGESHSPESARTRNLECKWESVKVKVTWLHFMHLCVPEVMWLYYWLYQRLTLCFPFQVYIQWHDSTHPSWRVAASPTWNHVCGYFWVNTVTCNTFESSKVFFKSVSNCTTPTTAGTSAWRSALPVILLLALAALLLLLPSYYALCFITLHFPTSCLELPLRNEAAVKSSRNVQWNFRWKAFMNVHWKAFIGRFQIDQTCRSLLAK